MKRAGGERAIKHTDVKQEAVDSARQISRNQQTELAIDNCDGRIAKKDSNGNDPRSTRG